MENTNETRIVNRYPKKIFMSDTIKERLLFLGQKKKLFFGKLDRITPKKNLNSSCNQNLSLSPLYSSNLSLLFSTNLISLFYFDYSTNKSFFFLHEQLGLKERY